MKYFSLTLVVVCLLGCQSNEQKFNDIQTKIETIEKMVEEERASVSHHEYLYEQMHQRMQKKGKSPQDSNDIEIGNVTITGTYGDYLKLNEKFVEEGKLKIKEFKEKLKSLEEKKNKYL